MTERQCQEREATRRRNEARAVLARELRRQLGPQEAQEVALCDPAARRAERGRVYRERLRAANEARRGYGRPVPRGPRVVCWVRGPDGAQVLAGVSDKRGDTEDRR